MTDTEMIANVVIAAVKAATAPMLERIAVLEARAPVPGPAGGQGEPGARGPEGHGVTVDELRPIVKEAVDGFREQSLSADEIAYALTDLLRKELTIEQVRVQKRIVRDANGKIDRVVEEVVQ